MTSDNVKPGMFIVVDAENFYYAALVLEKDINTEIFKVIEAAHGIMSISFQLIDIKGEIRTDTLDKIKQAICKITFTGKKWN